MDSRTNPSRIERIAIPWNSDNNGPGLLIGHKAFLVGLLSGELTFGGAYS